MQRCAKSCQLILKIVGTVMFSSSSQSLYFHWIDNPLYCITSNISITIIIGQGDLVYLELEVAFVITNLVVVCAVIFLSCFYITLL